MDPDLVLIMKRTSGYNQIKFDLRKNTDLLLRHH